MKNIGNKMAAGAIWMVFFKLTERSLGLISTIILARLLVPEDFGLIAMAMSMIAALELMSAFSFDVVLIQKQDSATRDHYNTAWTFNVLFGCLSALVLFLLAKPAALFYAEPRLQTVMYFLATGSLIQGIENIGIIAFRKDMNFNKEFIFQVGKKLAGFMVTVPLAFLLGNYWALVAGILSGKIAGVLLSYGMNRYRPWFSLACAGDLYHFSKWLFINNVVGFLKLRSADFILGKVSGSRQLGLYTIGYEISNLPTTELVAPINRAVFPGYSKIAHDLARLGEGFISVIGMITLLAVPAGVGIAATASLLVPVVLGEKWLEIIPLIQLLALSGAVGAMQTNIGPVYLSLGKPRVLTLLGAIHVLIFIPLVIFLSRLYGATGAAWASFITVLLMFPVNYLALLRVIPVSILGIAAVMWRPILASLLMFFVVDKYITQVSPRVLDGNIYANLFAAVAIGAIFYCLTVLLLWFVSGKPAGAEQQILEKVSGRLRVLFA